MHELRAAIMSGEKPIEPQAISREKCRRSTGRGSLIGIEIPRLEQRLSDQRREDRFRGVVDRATIVFRNKRTLVRVANVSTKGMMIDANLLPRIGETVGIVLEGQPPLEGIVRWIKHGQLGLDVGEESIDLS